MGSRARVAADRAGAWASAARAQVRPSAPATPPAPAVGGGDRGAPAVGGMPGPRRPAGPAPRRTWAFTVLVVALTGLAAVVLSVPMASTVGSLGPHRATYSIVTQHVIRIDLGPLGSLVLDSPLPWPLGVEVRVQEIPAELTADGSAAVSLEGDLDGYVRFFTQPDLALRDAARGLAADALRRTVLTWSGLLVLVAAGRLASRRGAFRLELRTVLSRPGVAALVVALSLVAAVAVVRDWRLGPSPAGRTSAVLAGTPLADARIVGRLGDIVDTYGGYALDAIERNETFYAQAAENLAVAYERAPAPPSPGEGAVAKSLAPWPPEEEPASADGAEAEAAGADAAGDVAEPRADLGDGQGAAGDDAGGAGDGAVAAVGGAAGEPGPSEADLRTFLLVTDLHCNVGVATVVGEAVRLVEPDAVLNAGDTVISGTSVEQFCVTALAEAVPSTVPVVVADGNHDSDLTSDQERRAGHVVLDGEPVTVAGVRILGDAEPVVTTVTEGVRRRGGETRDEMALRLAGQACEAAEAGEPVDILLVHNPRAGVTPMTSGCVALQLSGHFHRQLGPTHQGLGVLYAAGSTAGATANRSSIGPLQSPGVMTVLRYDVQAHRPVDYRVITVATDATVDVGRWLPFPGPPVVPVSADLDLADAYD